MTDKVSRDYFFEDSTKTVFYAPAATLNTGLTYIGTSDNPNPKMAAAVFMQQGKCHGRPATGCKIKEYTKE